MGDFYYAKKGGMTKEMQKTVQRKKLLTLDDLYSFYLNKNENCNFSSKETGYKLSVQVPAQFEINLEQNDDALLFCKVKLMHSGENRNHSSVTDDALVKASKYLAYKPILANFMEYTDKETGETLKDFTSHDMEFNDDGSVTYLEKQIGCFTSDEPYFEVEEDTGHNFLYGYCAIPKEYSDAYSIIKRKDGTKVSVELEINEMQYSTSKKLLELTDITIMGATCLGKNAITLNNVEEGMKNARLDIVDFSTENNSIKFNKDEKLIELLENLNKTLSNFNNKEHFSAQEKSKEGGNEEAMFEKLLEKYGKTIKDITFDYANLSDEELEQKFVELFDEAENTEIFESEPSNDGEGEVSTENSNDETETEGQEQFEKMVRTFEISHEDLRYALYNLLTAFEELDDDWYWIPNVYDSYFVYENCDGTKIYRQDYTKDGDNVVFTNERVELFKELLTASEKAELDAMRSNYASLKEFKENVEKNEIHAQKEAILNSEKYAVLTEKNEKDEYVNADFAELVRNMDNYSLADLETKIKVIHSDYIAEHSDFSFKNETKEQPKVFFMSNSNSDRESKKKTPYGGIFDKYNK